MKKKGLSKFSIILLSCVVLFLILLFIATRVITTILEEYESVQPVHTAESIVNSYFKAEDKTPLVELSSYDIPEYSTVENVADYLNSVIDSDDISFYNVSTPDSKVKSFAVSSNELKIALINLTESEEKSAHGFTMHKLDSVELLIAATDTVNIKAPKIYSVYVNGVLLTAEYTTGEIEPDINADKIPEDVVPLDYVTYKVNGLFEEPEITAFSDTGLAVSDITKSEDTSLYTVALADSEVPEDIKALVLDASERYAAYMQNDMTFAQLTPYLDKSADIYQNLRKSEVKWVNAHNGYSIENPEVLEFYMYSDSVFTCRVKFVHALHINGMDDYLNYFDTTFFFKKSGNDWLIYDSRVN